MPINSSMMKSMKSQYGAEKGERIYYALEQKQKNKSSSASKSSSNPSKPGPHEEAGRRILTKGK